MKYLAAALAFLALASCGTAPQTAPPPNPAQQAPVCRIGPNDGPVVAERGIGGTGMAPFTNPSQNGGNGSTPQPNSPAGQQDRGIGGTGMPASPSGQTNLADTGIVGEITGFASICVNGVEVDYNTAASIEIDGQPAPTASLRAGQVVAISASSTPDSPGTLSAQTITVRHEVSGPVSAVGANTLTVAGQAVAFNSDTRGKRIIQPGDWVAVSGFRNTQGVISATRIDSISPGPVQLHGQLRLGNGKFWIGRLQLQLPLQGITLQDGAWVTASGALRGQTLMADSVTPDLLFSNPSDYFGTQTNSLLIESYVETAGGSISLPGGAAVVPQGFTPSAFSGPAILSLQPIPGGGLRGIGISGPPAALQPIGVQSAAPFLTPPGIPGAGAPRSSIGPMPWSPGSAPLQGPNLNGMPASPANFNGQPMGVASGYTGQPTAMPSLTGPPMGMPGFNGPAMPAPPMGAGMAAPSGGQRRPIP